MEELPAGIEPGLAGSMGVSPRIMVDSSRPGLPGKAVYSSVGSGVWADRGYWIKKMPTIMNKATKKTPKKGREDFSFSPPKSKLTVIVCTT